MSPALQLNCHVLLSCSMAILSIYRPLVVPWSVVLLTGKYRLAIQHAIMELEQVQNEIQHNEDNGEGKGNDGFSCDIVCCVYAVY